MATIFFIIHKKKFNKVSIIYPEKNDVKQISTKKNHINDLIINQSMITMDVIQRTDSLIDKMMAVDKIKNLNQTLKTFFKKKTFKIKQLLFLSVVVVIVFFLFLMTIL